MAKKEKEVEVGSPQWKNHVLSVMDKSYVRDGQPTHDGLVQACRTLIGEITSWETHTIKPPNKEDRMAIIECKMSVKKNDGGYLGYTDIGDCYYYGEDANVDKPFHKHLASSASTKAANRVLRRLLSFPGVSWEERTNNEAEPQIDVKAQDITNMCYATRVNPDKLLEKHGNYLLENVSEMPESIFTNLMDELAEYEKGKDVPEELK